MNSIGKRLNSAPTIRPRRWIPKRQCSYIARHTASISKFRRCVPLCKLFCSYQISGPTSHESGDRVGRLFGDSVPHPSQQDTRSAYPSAIMLTMQLVYDLLIRAVSQESRRRSDRDGMQYPKCLSTMLCKRLDYGLGAAFLNALICDQARSRHILLLTTARGLLVLSDLPMSSISIYPDFVIKPNSTRDLSEIEMRNSGLLAGH